MPRTVGHNLWSREEASIYDLNNGEDDGKAKSIMGIGGIPNNENVYILQTHISHIMYFYTYLHSINVWSMIFHDAGYCWLWSSSQLVAQHQGIPAILDVEIRQALHRAMRGVPVSAHHCLGRSK